jgi:branched-chain amino acid transport system permease protein
VHVSILGITSDLLPQVIEVGISLGAAYGLVAVGFGLVFRATGLVNVLAGEYLVLGSLIAATMLKHMPLIPAVIVGVLGTVAVAAIAYDGVIRPVLRRSRDHAVGVIVQIAVMLALVGLETKVFGTNPTTIAPFSGRTAVHILNAAVPPQAFWVVGMLIVQLVVVQAILHRSWIGRAMRAAASNSMAAQMVGIKPTNVTRSVFMLAAAVAALAGIVLTPISAVSPGDGLTYTLAGFVAAVIGGFGSIWGGVLGGLVVGELTSFAQASSIAGYTDALVYWLLIVLLAVRFSVLSGRGKVA